MNGIRALVVSLAAGAALAGSPSAEALEAGRSEVPVRLGAKGKIVDGGNTAKVRVGVWCPAGWDPLEAFVYLVQDGNQSEYGYIPVTCDGLRHVYTVRVPALDVPFHDGDATGTAYVLLIDQGGNTMSGGDGETVTLMA